MVHDAKSSSWADVVCRVSFAQVEHKHHNARMTVHASSLHGVIFFTKHACMVNEKSETKMNDSETNG